MIDSILRTLVPVIVGHLLAWAAMVGLSLPEGAVTEIVAVVLTAAYYALGRWIEQPWPGFGRVLLSIGLARRTPVYVQCQARSSSPAAPRRPESTGPGRVRCRPLVISKPVE